MKSASAAFITHLGLPSTKLAYCVKVKRTDGTIYGFTDHDLDLDVDIGDGDGSITYDAGTAVNRTAIQSSAGLRVDELEAEGFLDSSAITAADLRAGRFDKAEVRTFLVIWSSLGSGIVRIRRGWIGEVEWTEGEYKAEVRGLMQAYDQEIVELATPDCRADLGDTRCRVQISPTTWHANLEGEVRKTRDASAPDAVSPTQYNLVKPSTQNGLYAECATAGTAGGTEPTWPTTVGGTVTDGTITWTMIRAYQQEGEVTAVNSQSDIDASGISEPGGSSSPTEQWWGLVEWLTGDNAGIKQEIQTDDGAGNLTFFLPAPFTIQAGDTFRVTAHCRKTRAYCVAAFRNVYNFQGEPDVPGNDELFSFPSAH